VDRELTELLNELRILLPGVQLVFAFLLTAPFSSAFDELTRPEHVAYIVAFAASAVASVLLIAPVVHHRARFRQGDKEALLRQANALALVAIGMLGLALAATTFVVFSFVVAPWAGALAASCVVGIELWLWVGRVAARPTFAERASRADVTQGV
jgi:protein-S-isoprenylcysteine O-methyltransferase Ste14